MTTAAQMPSGWQPSLLRAIGAPPGDVEDAIFFDNWFDIEHGYPSGNPSAETGGFDQGGKFNPFDTTLGAPGATNYNAVGVKNYPTAKVGIEATASTLEEPQYAELLRELRSGHASVRQLEEAEDASPWGTAFAVPSNEALAVPKSSAATAPHVTTAELTNWKKSILPLLGPVGAGMAAGEATGGAAKKALGAVGSIASAFNPANWKRLVLEGIFVVGGLAIAGVGLAVMAKGPAERGAQRASSAAEKAAPLALAAA